MRTAAAVLLCCLTPAGAGAQTMPPGLPSNDTVVAIGWTASEFRPERYDNWRGGLLVGVSGGHYWTDHLKTEIDGSWNSPGTDEIYEDLEYAGAITYAISNHRAHDLRFGVTQIYQFGRNAWVHPFVGAGVDIVRRRTRIDRREQTRTVYLPPDRSVPVLIPAADERRTDVFGQGVLKAGLKMYATEKAFFNTEFKLGFREDVDHVVWKVGVGVDF
ncbi:MAG: hypothetical protein EHM55_00995 [Acidobacteria bacterium]|nr:MAG: hypothetical protein EHM55_00995 [Acidobacteriota bacterium]